MSRLHHSQAPMVGQRRGDIGGAGRDNEGYGDVLDLNGCYFVSVCVMDPGRACELESRKEAKRRRKERMGTVPLLEFSSHRASGSRRRQG